MSIPGLNSARSQASARSRRSALESARSTFRAELTGRSAATGPTSRSSARGGEESLSQRSQRTERSGFGTARSGLTARTQSAYDDLGASISARSNNGGETWRTDDLNTARINDMMKELTMERKSLQKRLVAVQEEIEKQDVEGGVEGGRVKKEREPVIKTRKPMFLKPKRTRKFLLKKY